MESKKRQYALADLAAEYGFEKIKINDRDQGISGSEAANRKGFQEVVADVSLGKVGIIFCLEVSRLARNNRDWYYLGAVDV